LKSLKLERLKKDNCPTFTLKLKENKQPNMLKKKENQPQKPDTLINFIDSVYIHTVLSTLIAIVKILSDLFRMKDPWNVNI